MSSKQAETARLEAKEKFLLCVVPLGAGRGHLRNRQGEYAGSYKTSGIV